MPRTSACRTPGRRAPSGLSADVADLYAVAIRDRWGVALAAVGWVHLAVFLVCQGLYGRGDRAVSHFLPLWGLDLGVGLLVLRAFLAGAPAGARSRPSSSWWRGSGSRS